MDYMDFIEIEDAAHGLACLERLAQARGWDVQALENGDRSMVCETIWGNLQLNFSWQAAHHSLLIHCAMDMILPEDRLQKAQELMGLINARLWIGHFTLSTLPLKPTYRHTLLMFGEDDLKSLEIEEIVETALGECERFYPAFQFCIWGEQSAQDALEAALVDCVGSA